MKKYLFPVILLTVAISLNSCFTLISSIASTPAPKPTTTVVTTPTTVVTVPATVVTTTTVHKPAQPTQTQIVVTNEPDFYRALDLRAVAAAFAESRSVREFEQLLNSNRYMVSNLDLNGDGWIDYLRVMEVMQGWTHVLHIQAVLAPNVFQNVASVIVETQSGARFVQVVGDPFIYGPNYYINPVFRATPPMYTVMCTRNYTCWSSPYYWNYYPSYYVRPAPVYVTHYEAYVTTYITNHNYCREVTYVETPHCSNYSTIGGNTTRHDYAVAHPTQSFSTRYNSASNARQFVQSANTRTNTNTSTNTNTNTNTGSSRTQASTATPSSGSTSSRAQSSTTTSTTNRTPAAGTTTTTNTGSSRTQASTATPSSGSTSSRAQASTTTTSRVASTASSNQNTTTVSTRVQSNGRQTTTVTRQSAPSSTGTSTRSTQTTGTSTRSTQTTGTSTRSTQTTGTSTRTQQAGTRTR